MKVYAIGSVVHGVKNSDGSFERREFGPGDEIDLPPEEAKALIKNGSATKDPNARTVNAKEAMSAVADREATDASRGGSPDDDDAADRDAGKTPQKLSDEAAKKAADAKSGK